MINWALMIDGHPAGAGLPESSNLAAAYGIAVTGAMFIDSCLLAVVLFRLWNWPLGLLSRCSRSSSSSTWPIFGANLIKVPDGGWFPLLVGVVAFTLLTTWAKGRKLTDAQMRETAIADRTLHLARRAVGRRACPARRSS